MKPVTIKPVMNSQKPVSAMTVNTQVRTGVNKIRREVQTSAAIYIGDTTEMTINLAPGEVFSLNEVSGVSALSLTTSGRIDFTHKPNNTHDHTLSIEQQFSCDYLLTSIQLSNPSTVDSVSVSLVYVPFTGTLPEEQPCGGVDPVDPVPTINGTLSWWQDIFPLPVPPGADTPTYMEEGHYMWVFQLQLDEPAPTPPYLSLRLPVPPYFDGTPALVEYAYFDGYSDPSAGSYTYQALLRMPDYTDGSSYGVIHIGANSTGDYNLVVSELATEDLPRAPNTPPVGAVTPASNFISWRFARSWESIDSVFVTYRLDESLDPNELVWYDHYGNQSNAGYTFVRNGEEVEYEFALTASAGLLSVEYRGANTKIVAFALSSLTGSAKVHDTAVTARLEFSPAVTHMLRHNGAGFPISLSFTRNSNGIIYSSTVPLLKVGISNTSPLAFFCSAKAPGALSQSAPWTVSLSFSVIHSSGEPSDTVKIRVGNTDGNLGFGTTTLTDADLAGDAMTVGPIYFDGYKSEIPITDNTKLSGVMVVDPDPRKFNVTEPSVTTPSLGKFLTSMLYCKVMRKDSGGSLENEVTTPGQTTQYSTTLAAVFHHRYNSSYTSVGRIAATSYCFPGEEPGSRDISRNY